ncbi:MetQ/NlpA family ABC transporter substrate-binding protein [Paenibacillus sp. URB8-2]|uniref:MetQ/NlpA family ABC transporter substrate-binding protein n=1 Tax=Paenibacillus sp. URB8-2 TaxID=2741301 RepID=UPI0015BD43A2|nr:MetQ/NlpA family ABC transporter substrate-binding protein [Paenibacillus sp. URB8-2]BCG59107.1 metal ABC transporter substrate-binding protein [Paenibacillus sp. URB8-2]
MTKSRKIIIAAISLIVVILIAGGAWLQVSGSSKNETLVFGVAPGPYGDMIRKAIQPELEKKGYKVEIKEFTDYVQPDLALGNKEITANLFQHERYLKKFSADHSLELSSITNVPTAALGVYSKTLTAGSLEELKSKLKPGDIVSVPNDPTNQARALQVLVKSGLITIKNEIDPTKASEKDIDQNPYGLVFQPVEAAQLPRSLDSVTLSAINGNYAIAAGIPLGTAVIKEELSEDLKNVIAIRTEDKDKDFAKAIVEVVNSEAFKNEIESDQHEFKDFQRPQWYSEKWNIANK